MLIVWAIIFAAIATPAAADPVTLVGLAATAAGSAVTAAISAPILCPVVGAAVQSFLGGEREAEPEAPPEAELRFFGVGPSLIVPSAPDPGSGVWGQTFPTREQAQAMLDDMAERDLALSRKAQPHGPLGAVPWACRGHCLGERFAEGDVVFYSGSGYVQPGDVAMFLVRGEGWALKRVKVFCGTVGPRDVTQRLFGSMPGPFAVFYQTDPATVILVPWGDITSLVRATHRFHAGETTRLGAMAQRAWIPPHLLREINAGPVPAKPLPDDLVTTYRGLLANGAAGASQAGETALAAV